MNDLDRRRGLALIVLAVFFIGVVLLASIPD